MLINQSICYINEILKAGIFNDIDGGNARQFGVCELIKNADNKQKMPAELQGNGEAIYAGIDDTYTSVSYHRIQDIAFATETLTSYGDGLESVIETAAATFFCYVKQHQAKIAAHDLASKIGQVLSFSFPKEKLDEIKAKSIKVTPVNALIDTEGLLKQEYNITDLELVGEAYMISLKYQIILKYNACQNKCAL